MSVVVKPETCKTRPFRCIQRRVSCCPKEVIVCPTPICTPQFRCCSAPAPQPCCRPRSACQPVTTCPTTMLVKCPMVQGGFIWNAIASVPCCPTPCCPQPHDCC